MDVAIPHDERLLTETDHRRLAQLVHAPGRGPAAARGNALIDAVLDAADLVAPQAVPPDLVTMNSQVELADLASGRRYRLTLSYPAEAEPALGRVSVLSPVGASLIGLRVGAIARWSTPGGEPGAAAVAALLFQPEAGADDAG